MNGPIIRLTNVVFSYGRRPVLEDLSLEIYEGERVGLYGPNGSGKTTLLYIIMGLLKPQKGTVEIFGKIREKEKDFLDVRQKIGLLFQDPDSQLFCPTVREDIAFGPLNLGKTRDEAKKIVKKTCEILGLNGLEDRITSSLSGGEKRLVSLATILAMEPVCFLLDEPSSGLDEESTDRLAKYLNSSKKTCLIVSHDRNFMERCTERILFLKNGRIV